MSKERGESAARRRILDTATKLFYQNGIRATGIDAVVEQSGVARMTLYNHFPTKEALVEATIAEAARTQLEFIEGVATDQSVAPSQRLMTVFKAATGKTCSEGFRGCAMVNAVIEHPDHSSKAYCAAVIAKQSTVEVLERLAREMGASDPRLLSEQLMLLVDGNGVAAQMGRGEAAVHAANAAAEILIEAATTR